MPSFKQRLAIDLDGTAALWDPRLNSGYEARGHHNHPMLLDIRHDYSLATGDAALDLVTAEVMNESGFYAELEPMPFIKDAIPVLDEFFDIHFLSQPWPGNRTCASDKYTWIEEHFGEQYVTKTTLTFDKTLFDAAILIDDKPKITGANPNPTWVQVFFDQPYNRQLEGQRIKDWSNPESLALYFHSILNEQKAVFA